VPAGAQRAREGRESFLANWRCDKPETTVAVGTPVARRPPHRSGSVGAPGREPWRDPALFFALRPLLADRFAGAKDYICAFTNRWAGEHAYFVVPLTVGVVEPNVACGVFWQETRMLFVEGHQEIFVFPGTDRIGNGHDCPSFVDKRTEHLPRETPWRTAQKLNREISHVNRLVGPFRQWRETVLHVGMKRIFWNCASWRRSISSVASASWKPYWRALVVSDITSHSMLNENRFAERPRGRVVERIIQQIVFSDHGLPDRFLVDHELRQRETLGGSVAV